MKMKIFIVTTSIIIAFGFNGCGTDYKWDTDNTSALEGKYETRDKSHDLNSSEQAAVAKSLAQRFLYADFKTTGISVSIMNEDNTTINFAYGCAKLRADVEQSGILDYETGHSANCEEALTPTHRMKLGSLTKTAVARTILDIDDNSDYDFSINDYITKHLPSNILALGDLSGITVSQLLHHNSGLNKIDFTAGTVEEIIQKFLDKGRLFNPGQMYQYNNAGYVLLGQIIEHVTSSKHWQTEVQKRLDDSIGVNSFIFPEAGNVNWIDTEWLVGQEGTLRDANQSLVTGYSYSDAYISLLEISGADTAHSAGSMIGSVPDVTKWMRTAATNDSSLLSANYFDNTVRQINTGTYIDSYMGHLNWNMGAGIGFDQDQNALFHLGNFFGYACSSVYSKNEKVTVTACINSTGDIEAFPYEVLEAMYPYRTTYLPTSTIH